MKLRKLYLRVLAGTFSIAFAAQVVAGVGEGQELYDAYCQICHGGLGEGQTMGKPLTDRSAEILTDEALIEVITGGRSGTGMAAWGSSLDTTEILDVAAYVRVLQGGTGLTSMETDNSASSDPAVIAGEQIFNGSAGCVSCHSYRDQGGNVGPGLDGITSRLDDTQLLLALTEPSRSIAEGYAVKVVEQQDGSIIRGRFRNDSALAVQIQSADGERWVTYFKDRVNSISDSPDSLMPDVFANMGADDQENLLEFLRSL